MLFALQDIQQQADLECQGHGFEPAMGVHPDTKFFGSRSKELGCGVVKHQEWRYLLLEGGVAKERVHMETC